LRCPSGLIFKVTCRYVKRSGSGKECDVRLHADQLRPVCHQASATQAPLSSKAYVALQCCVKNLLLRQTARTSPGLALILHLSALVRRQIRSINLRMATSTIGRGHNRGEPVRCTEMWGLLPLCTSLRQFAIVGTLTCATTSWREITILHLTVSTSVGKVKKLGGEIRVNYQINLTLRTRRQIHPQNPSTMPNSSKSPQNHAFYGCDMLLDL
jgi:hypothetical protein